MKEEPFFTAEKYFNLDKWNAKFDIKILVFLCNGELTLVENCKPGALGDCLYFRMPKNFSVKSNNLSLHQIPCSFRVLCASHWLYREFCCQSAWSFRRFQMDSGILLLQGVCHHTGNRWDNGSTSVESGYRPCPYRRENPLKIWGKNILQIIWNRMSTMHRLI